VSPPSHPPGLEEVLEILRAAYPREGCGVVLTGPHGHRVLALPNACDPARAAAHFQFDDAAWLATLTEVDARDESLACLFHSHVDSPADFSAQDVQAAAPGGTPLFPGVAYLVVSVTRHGPSEIRFFSWSGASFQESRGVSRSWQASGPG